MGSHLLLLAPPPAHMIRKDPVLEAYQQEITYVFHALRWLGARPQEIEDLAQEVFIALRRSWPHYDSSRPLRPYLFGVAFRVVSMQRRKRKREVAFASLEIRDGGPGPDEALQAKQARAMVLRALERIPLRRRAVLVMHDLEEVPMAPGRRDALDSLVHGILSAAQGAHGAGGGDSPGRRGREQAMKTPPPLSPELEALLAPHRTVLPLAPSVEARAIARAVAAAESPEHGAGRASAGRGGCSRRRPAWCSPSAQARTPRARGSSAASPRPRSSVAPIASPRASEPRPRAVVAATAGARGAGDDRAARSPRVRRIVGKTSAAAAGPDQRGAAALAATRARTSRAAISRRALAVIAEHVPQVSQRQPGRRARSLARQVAGGARASRRSAARGGPVPRAVSAQRVPLDVRTHEGGGPLTTRGWWLSALSAAAAL